MIPRNSLASIHPFQWKSTRHKNVSLVLTSISQNVLLITAYIVIFPNLIHEVSNTSYIYFLVYRYVYIAYCVHNQLACIQQTKRQTQLFCWLTLILTVLSATQCLRKEHSFQKTQHERNPSSGLFFISYINTFLVIYLHYIFIFAFNCSLFIQVDIMFMLRLASVIFQKTKNFVYIWYHNSNHTSLIKMAVR